MNPSAFPTTAQQTAARGGEVPYADPHQGYLVVDAGLASLLTIHDEAEEYGRMGRYG